MPTQYSDKIKSLTQDQFHKIDHRVTGIAFDVHNSLGRLHDEKTYQAAIYHRVCSTGIYCERESEIQVCHKSFKKSYFIDLIIGGVPYETKTAFALSNKNEAQLLNYLMLTNISHGKLINFRTASVESKFISTQLTRSKRQQFNLEATNSIIKETLRDLLQDWGTHLSISLYKDALYQLLDCHEDTMDIIDRGVTLGSQRIFKSHNGTGIVVSGITKTDLISNYYTHLKRLLHNSNLPAIDWINFNQSNITQSTLEQ